jgi:hypothetical protein
MWKSGQISAQVSRETENLPIAQFNDIKKVLKMATQKVAAKLKEKK